MTKPWCVVQTHLVASLCNLGHRFIFFDKEAIFYLASLFLPSFLRQAKKFYLKMSADASEFR